jgi:ferrous-iron efflux pump FieF
VGRVAGAGDSVNQLMDAEWPVDKREPSSALRRLSRAQGHARRPHPLSGRTTSSSSTSGCPEDWTIKEAHDRLDRVEEDLQRRFPGTEIFLHLDPEGHTDREGMLPHELTERRR